MCETQEVPFTPAFTSAWVRARASEFMCVSMHVCSSI